MENPTPEQPTGSHSLEVYGDLRRITTIFNWFVGLMLASQALGIIILLAYRDVDQALILGASAIPVAFSIPLIRRKEFERAAAFLALIMIVMITLVATNGEGVHSISLLGMPAILIVASLVIRERIMILLTVFSLGCVAWLVFGALAGIYAPRPILNSVSGDFFTVSLVLISTAVMVRLMSESLFSSSQRLQKELRERTAMEAQRERLIAELEAKNAELERYAYTVSHDLKSPLITISGFLGLLEQDAAGGDRKQLARDRQRIQAAVVKMQRLLDELLELSRIGRLMNPPETFPFAALVGEVLTGMQGQLEARRVRVIVQPGLPQVHGDRQRVAEALQNLIDNALKFMGGQADPVIEIGQQAGADRAPAFFVRDNGIGIAPAYHGRIFSLFEKLDPRTDGTGVGLAIVKRIVEVHGGRVWVESEEGRGATFFFTLGPGGPEPDRS